MDLNFSSLDELYSRIKPALYSKKEELIKLGLTYLKEEDIWNFLSETKWVNTKNLTLFDMVTDIMDIQKQQIHEYCIDYFKRINRELIINEENLL